MASLNIVSGLEPGRKHDLNGSKFDMGRAPDCQIVIPVESVSRKHARILNESGSFFLEDLQSRNKTYLNDVAIATKQPLRHGDTIRICDVVFRFVSETPPPQKFLAGLPAGGASSHSSKAEMFDDDAPTAESTIMKRLGLGSGRNSGVGMMVSAEAKLSAMLEIMSSTGKSIALDEVLPKVLAALMKIFIQADRGFIVLKSPSGELIPKWAKMRRENDADSLRISRTICRMVMESKEAILSADAANDKAFELSQSIADFRIRSMMCAPLLDSDGNAMGVLQIDTLDQRHRFTESDLELLVSAAGQAAVVIDNAQLHEQALSQKELQRDLELAHQMQKGFLPASRPSHENYLFFDFYRAANHVGGDYYDYIRMPDGRYAVIVADVVGHGVAAAMLMAKLSAEARFALGAEPTPAKAMTMLNDRLAKMNLGRFVTMVLSVIDFNSGVITVVNAGHMAPMVRRANGTIEEPSDDIAGLPLGIMESIEYDQCTAELAPGDYLVQYTDGINESMNTAGELYTIERIKELVAAETAPEVLSDTLLKSVEKFVGTAPQADDMCMVIYGRVR
jgi:phosphoserine phosphatase RsbU/P